MNRLHATKDFWLAALRADSPMLQDALVQAGPDAAVPSRPDRTLADLTADLTDELRWLNEHVRRGSTENPGPVTRSPRGTWAEQLAALNYELSGAIRTLEGLESDVPAWNWAPQRKTAGFWHRRLAHEISMQRWDAEGAAGHPSPIETTLAADGVGEVLDTWLPAGRRQGPGDLHGVAHLVASDAGYEWFVRLRGPGVALLDTLTILDTDDHHARAQANGTASDLLLVLMGRQRTDRLVISGDPRLIAALRTG